MCRSTKDALAPTVPWRQMYAHHLLTAPQLIMHTDGSRCQSILVVSCRQKEEGGDKQRKGRFRDNDGLAALLAVSVSYLLHPN